MSGWGRIETLRPTSLPFLLLLDDGYWQKGRWRRSDGVLEVFDEQAGCWFEGGGDAMAWMPVEYHFQSTIIEPARLLVPEDVESPGSNLADANSKDLP